MYFDVCIDLYGVFFRCHIAAGGRGRGIEVVLYCQLQLSRSMWKFFQVDPAWWLVFAIWEGHLSILQNRSSRKCSKVFLCAVSGPWDPSEGP